MPNNSRSEQIIGSGIDRVDGLSKVSGRNRYVGETDLTEMAYAVAITSTIAAGRVRVLDVSGAKKCKGVLDVLTGKNAPRLNPLPKNGPIRSGQSFLVLQDDSVRYYGQYLAVVVAETLEQAQYAAGLVRIEYDIVWPTIQIEDALDDVAIPPKILLVNPPPVDASRGNPAGAFEVAPVKLDLTYRTPIQTHNPMEPHVTVAVWKGNDLILHESSQWVQGAQYMVAAHLGLKPEQVRVVSPSVGGGFGSKGVPWPHMTLAAIASRRVGRPVKLSLSRQQMFAQTGHRPATLQKIRLGANHDGRLLATIHETVSSTSRFDDFVEASGQGTRVLYSCPNLASTHRIVHLDVNTPAPMRGPGEASGSFALESAMDELAYATGIDPLEIRLRNYADVDEDTSRPFSSKSLRTCYERAAETFGWKERPAAVRAMRKGHEFVGWGMATAAFPVKLSPACGSVRLNPDGTVDAASATHELGTGTYTAMTQVVADTLGLPMRQVRFQLGDTTLPDAPSSAGSQTAASVGSALFLAAQEVRQQLIGLAVHDVESPLFGAGAAEISVDGGELYMKRSPERRDGVTEILQRRGRAKKLKPLEATVRWLPSSRAARPWSGWSFGAHFCEVRVDADYGVIRVTRWVAAFAGGRILNPKTAMSQLKGGIVWGISQALLEQTVYDRYSGVIVNNNLADYHVPVNADIPPIEAFLIDEEDGLVNPLGVKGVGELGICGSAAAVANAVYHATGVRVRDLPVTLDKLLAML